MPTKLSRYAEGVMEAVWLSTIILVPLFFNKYSSRIFEPDKLTLLRTLALITLAAWVIKLIEQGRQSANGEKWSLKRFFRTPLVAPVITLALAYLLATIFSVAPRISLWGSYQRLQGLYTTFSYLVLFAAIAGNIRKRVQVDRIITVAILTSLPISLYGVLQHYGIDPIPWGGDVTRRVASNLGNSIFVAAFLITTFPLTIGRIIESFNAILKESEGLGKHISRATVYIFIAALQFIIIAPPLYFSRSRGPLLGWLAGMFFLFVLLSIFWKQRKLLIVVMSIGLIAAAFLITLNIPDGPLQDLREDPTLKRLGQLIDIDHRTAKVRIYIWEGAVDMVLPHDPIEYPDNTTDSYNSIRTLIGYGPETMHMAYNPFYPPGLGHVEKRNASPDRSHNETWDALVITGVFGLIAYIFVFGSIFYFGLKWIGLIPTKQRRNLFIALFLGGGIAGVAGFIIWQGPAFFGVGLAFGILIGITSFLVLSALFIQTDVSTTKYSGARAFILIILLASIVSHFVEINFGIAIAATRTYFWVFSALLLAVGHLLPKYGEYLSKEASQAVPERSESQSSTLSRGRKRRKLKTRRKVTPDGRPEWIRAAIIGGFITSLILVTLGYEFVANLRGETSAITILWTSLTRVQKQALSYGVLALTITAWLASSIVIASESRIIPAFDSNNQKGRKIKWGYLLWTVLGISLAVALLYMLWLSGTLASLARTGPSTTQEVIEYTASFGGLLTKYYSFIFLLIFGLAAFLPEEWPVRVSKTAFGPILATFALVIALVIGNNTNLKVIHADVTFKLAESFTKGDNWPLAVELYQESRKLAPNEDYYYLFLGRAYLEQAKLVENEEEQEKIINRAKRDLEAAQVINPLNPDHTANLGRLYSWWALQAQEKSVRKERGEISNSYYERVTALSPQNARLWNEWAIVYINILNDQENSYDRLMHSLEIDPEYDWTHALLAEYFAKIARQKKRDDDQEGSIADYEKAAYHYNEAIKWVPRKSTKNKKNYYYALVGVYQNLKDYPMAISTLEDSLDIASSDEDIWRTQESITNLYLELKEYDKALIHAQRALVVAPDNERERLETLIQQIESIP